MIKTGRKLIRVLPGVLSPSVLRWASQFISLLPVASSFGMLLCIYNVDQSRLTTSLRAELDRTIFSLDKVKRLIELKKQRDYIIKRLNTDFQKIWFGRNSASEAVELEDMTYSEVVRRMVELMYVKHESRWIDPSLKRLTGDHPTYRRALHFGRRATFVAPDLCQTG